MSLDLTLDKSVLVQVMACCRQATSYYLSQCWHRSMSSFGVTRPQWFNGPFLLWNPCLLPPTRCVSGSVWWPRSPAGSPSRQMSPSLSGRNGRWWYAPTTCLPLVFRVRGKNLARSGARPTNGISIEFEIRSKFGIPLFKMCESDHNKILHTSRRCYCFYECTDWVVVFLKDCIHDHVPVILYDSVHSVVFIHVCLSPHYTGKPMTVSAAFSGRVAVAYRLGGIKVHNNNPDSKFVNLCVSIYECESSGQWQ